MQITDLFAAELDRETARSRRALENLPEGKSDWKPHEKSMAFGYLANLVAIMPTWIAMMLRQDELDIAPPGGSSRKWPNPKTRAEYLAALDSVGSLSALNVETAGAASPGHRNDACQAGGFDPRKRFDSLDHLIVELLPLRFSVAQEVYVELCVENLIGGEPGID